MNSVITDTEAAEFIELHSFIELVLLPQEASCIS
jgi:hypothetical protein